MAMNLTRVTPEGERVPVFPSIASDSASYTFANNDGLLNATQFAQPALVLVEMAQFLDLKDGEPNRDTHSHRGSGSARILVLIMVY